MFVRSLNKADWKEFKRIRLEALTFDAGRFSARLSDESVRSDDVWQSMLEHEGQKCFGLFHGKEMVGITAIFTDGQDSSGKTAFLVMSYIRKEYRGKGYSRLLYDARLQWAREQGCYDRIMVGHREGNEASRRANQAFGFSYIESKDNNFGDGTTDKIHHYEMRLR